MTIPTRTIFEMLGFEAINAPITDEQPDYFIPIGRHRVEMAQMVNFRMVPIFQVSGVINTGRSIHMIEAEMRLEMDSYEQGVAWLAYILRDVFRQFEKPDWLIEGEGWADQLPWRLDAARAAPRSSCKVPREWFRLAAKQLRTLAETAEPLDEARFDFDGLILTLNVGAAQIPLPAKGDAWDRPAWVRLAALADLPKRLVYDPVTIAVWDTRLGIANTRFMRSDVAAEMESANADI